MMTSYRTWNGYCVVKLCKNNHPKECRVHRLVTTAFIANPNNYPCVNHKDENKENNIYSNLEWCDHQYNNTYGTRVARQKVTIKETYNKKKKLKDLI